MMHEVLHALAIKKHGDVAAIASLAAIDEAAVSSLLARAVATGRAVQTDDKYLLSPAGHMILETHYSRRYAALRADEEFIETYERFELINTELKQVITDWQTMDVGGRKLPNDHSDDDHDERCIDRLARVHEKIAPLFKHFISRVQRFRIYFSKLETALDKAEDGAREWVSDATIESYHTVWFEMHEDLLRVLGRVREE